MAYLVQLLVLCTIFTVLVASLDILVGHTGILSLSHAAFYGLGAYVSALMAVRLGGSLLVGVITGMGVASVISLAVSLPSMRLHGDYFVIATFGFQVIIFSIFNNWMSLTNGPMGVGGIPQPTVFGWTIKTQGMFLVLGMAAAALGNWVVWRIASSPFGRVLHAIREDEVLTKALGKNTMRFKVVTFAVSAALAALAGSLYAYYVTYIDPTSFTVMESILVISMVIVGGAGSTWGPLIGAVVLVTLPEALRFIGLPSSTAANLRQIFYGVLLVTMMMFRPRGLVGRYGFGR